MARTEIKDASGKVIGWNDTRDLSSEEANEQAIIAAAISAMQANRTFIALGTAASAAQVRNETLALARQVNGVIRLLLNQLEGTD